MKKMTFALACASAFAVFADEAAPKAPLADFEQYALGAAVADAIEPGSGSTSVYWLYGAASGSEDGSKVAGDDSAKYLELSTEGGTLWRSINAGDTSKTGDAKLGTAETIGATGLYVDTMVQFTPTEDGGAPELGDDDKLAIWLNVDANGVTNLMVKANAYTMGDGPEAVASSFTLVPSDDSELVIDAGSWHQLEVRMVANVFSTSENGVIPGFLISVDGKQMKAASGTPIAGDFAEFIASDLKAANGVKALFPSLQEMGDPSFVTTLQAVGFKGSGAIDNLSISTTAPTPEGVEVDLTISAENATVAGITAGKVEVGSNLTFTVTADAGYNVTAVKVNGTAVEAGTAGSYSYTVAEDDEAVAVVVTTEAIPQIDWDHPDTSAGTTAGDMFKLTGPIAAADGAKVATWAKANGVDFADASTTIKMDAFLLNCANDNDAITTAKAAFKIVSIEQDAKGAWVAKVTGEKGDGAEYGNGYVVIKGSATVDGTYELATTAETAKFFKAFLVLEAPTAE